MVLWAGLLVVVILGIVLAMRHGQQRQRQREQQAASLTELTFVPALRNEIARLREDTRRLRRERDELLGVMTQLAKLLESYGEGPTKRPQ